MPAVLNAANEEAVGLFMERKIGFMDIPIIIEEIMCKHSINYKPELDDIIEVDLWTRDMIKNMNI